MHINFCLPCILQAGRIQPAKVRQAKDWHILSDLWNFLIVSNYSSAKTIAPMCLFFTLVFVKHWFRLVPAECRKTLFVHFASFRNVNRWNHPQQMLKLLCMSMYFHIQRQGKHVVSCVTSPTVTSGPSKKRRRKEERKKSENNNKTGYLGYKMRNSSFSSFCLCFVLKFVAFPLKIIY